MVFGDARVTPSGVRRPLAACRRGARDHLDHRRQRGPRTRHRPRGDGGPREQGAAEPVPGPIGARSTGRASGGDVRPGGPRVGPRGSRGTAPLPRRTRDDAAAADRRGARRLRQGAATAHRTAEDGGGCAVSRRPQQRRRHPRCVGRTPGRARRAAGRGSGGVGQRAVSGGREGVPAAGAGVAARGDPATAARSSRSTGRTRPWSSSRRRFWMHSPVGGMPRSSAGVCLVGPHRDDLELRLGDQVAKGFASHGESWSMALALAAGGLRTAARRGRRSRCCCSTTCSRNSIPRGGARLPRSRRRPSRYW